MAKRKFLMSFFFEKHDYTEIEIGFSNLANEYKDNLSYIIELDKLLNIYLKQMGENKVDIEQKKRMCFILNRASFYLSNKEIIKEQYDLNILIKRVNRSILSS